MGNEENICGKWLAAYPEFWNSVKATKVNSNKVCEKESKYYY